MDIKEPSVHSSKRSRSQTNVSNTNTQQTIDSVTMKITIDPVSKLLNKLTFPMLINCLLESLVMMFQVMIVWHYCGPEGVKQLAIALPICYFVSQAIPKAIGQGAVAFLSKNIADNEVKKADETMCYYFILQAGYLVISLFLAFFLSLAFPAIAGISTAASDTATGPTNLAVAYLPTLCTVGTLLGIFNEASQGLLLAENKFVLNLVRSVATSLLTLLFQLICYQFSVAQNKNLSLGQLALGQVLGSIIPSVAMALYYQDFFQLSFQGVIKAKFKYLKQFNVGALTNILANAAPKISQFGSTALLVFSCNIVVKETYTEDTDIQVARIGLLFYFCLNNLFGFAANCYLYVSQAAIGLNLTLKKYIRTKDIIMKSFIWGIVIQAVLLIIGMLAVQPIAGFFMPQSQSASKEFFLLYGVEYLTYAIYLPIVMVPYHFCQALNSIENNWKMNAFINLMHPVIGVCSLLTIQFTVGDRALLYYPMFFADIFSGFSGLILLARKLFEVMQLAKIELRRLKKQKKAAEIDAQIAKEDGHEDL